MHTSRGAGALRTLVVRSEAKSAPTEVLLAHGGVGGARPRGDPRGQAFLGLAAGHQAFAKHRYGAAVEHLTRSALAREGRAEGLRLDAHKKKQHTCCETRSREAAGDRL